ncbi:heavy metal translocating P-type ATPase [Desulfurella sp.]|uniref:heavy metal translocating P-type ATPase n=1 Tax=Desulfurella sp. TaxID=1962857 RepID=UPI0025B9E877|nr:heavy metal translocating P-type ATPase [Desulfurella sp.]
MEKVTLNLEGMNCASCALSIEKALKKVDGVETANVNLVSEKATILGVDLKADVLIQAVKNAGYKASLDNIEKIQDNTEQNTKIYQVNGMSCAACAINVEKALKKVPGVITASVNIATEKASVTIDPNIVSERDMAKAVQMAGYELLINQDKQSLNQDDSNQKLKKAKLKMIWAWVITGPLSVLMIAHMSAISIPYFSEISLIASFIVIFIVGKSLIKSGFTAIVHKSFSMDVLIFLGVCASYLSGILSALGGQIADYSAVGAMIMGFYLIGQYLEAKAKGKASEAIKKLISMSPKTANLVEKDGSIVSIDAKNLVVGDVVLVKPSQQIPADGIIVEGNTTVDESMVTGEFLPKTKNIGDRVIGSCINQSGAIKVRVTGVGEDTFLAQMVKLVEQAMGTKVPIQRFADKVVGIFVPFVIFVSVVTFLFWFLDPKAGHSITLWASSFLPWVNPNLNALSAAVFASIATLVVACPCALGLATPTALMVGSGLGARHGILIRSGDALQGAKDIDTVIFDKTGTLTTGKVSVSEIYTTIDKEEFLKLTASLESYSEHPLAKAVVDYAKSNNVEIHSASDVEVKPGLGIKGTVLGKTIIIGNANYIKTSGLSLPKNVLDNDNTLSFVMDTSGNYLGYIAFKDTLKENAKKAILELKNMNIRTVMLTGDSQSSAKQIANILGIDEVYYNLLPQEKLEYIKKFQQKAHVVAMVGDGINDAPSLKQANIGIAIGTGTDIAKEASDITLVGSDLEAVAKAIRLSKATFNKIKQNLFWAFFYNLVAIPIAALGLLHPAIAEAAMAASSVNVVTNSLRLKKYKL